MTALKKYQRLEAIGLWREHEADQRREVIVSLGEATLVMSSASGDALGHWSLPAIERLNQDQFPAFFTPSAESSEILELEDAEMVAAIDRIRTSIDRKRPHPGRLRLGFTIGVLAVVVGLAAAWVPGAMTTRTLDLLPTAKRLEIGQQLLAEITTIAGRPCGGGGGRAALMRIAARTFGADTAPRIVMLPATIPDTVSLPGNVIVASARLVEDYETPDVLAGFLLAEAERRAGQDPVEAFLQQAGLRVTFRLLTTGDVDNAAIHAHAARLLSQDARPVGDDALLERFAVAEISSVPYAYARDVSGETVLGLIEADPMRVRSAAPVLTDAEWVSLQEICTR